MQNISIVIPFYNGDVYIDSCLKSVSLGACARVEKIIVNNSDEITEIHSIASAYDHVTVIDAEPRMGFGRACNEGARVGMQKESRYIIVLNQDSIAHEDLVLELIKPFYEYPDIVITAPIQYDYAFSSVDRTFASSYLSRCPDLFSDALKHKVKSWYKVDRMSGACFAIRSDFINKYGLFDPTYFMYYEDDDLCRRIEYLNYHIALVPGARVAHDNHAHVPSNQLKELDLWGHQSRTIFKLKDVRDPLLKACVKTCYSICRDYMTYFASWKFSKVRQAFFSDLMLLSKLPVILHNRRKENLLRRIGPRYDQLQV